MKNTVPRGWPDGQGYAAGSDRVIAAMVASGQIAAAELDGTPVTSLTYNEDRDNVRGQQRGRRIGREVQADLYRLQVRAERRKLLGLDCPQWTPTRRDAATTPH